MVDEQINKLRDYLYNDITRRTNFGMNTGIVIAGYGENEIYPLIFNCILYGVADTCLLHAEPQKDSISPSSKAIIMPFAQSEMVSSFMEGIDPSFEKLTNKEIQTVIEKIKELIEDGKKDKLDEIQNMVIEEIGSFKRKTYIEPIINILNNLYLKVI